MALTSFWFLIFAAAVVLAYYLTPVKYRWVTLLIASYAFYAISSIKTLIFMVATTVITFYGGRRLGQINAEHKAYLAEHKSELSRDDKKELKAKVQSRKKKVVAVILIFNFGVLAFLKYFRVYITALIPGINLGILIPLGISFYTFQAAAYIIDLYRVKYDADDNIAKFGLFMSFFPQIIQGPIARHDQLAAQLYEGHRFEYKNLTYGAQLILWGFFKKLIIADRVAIMASEVFDNPGDYQGAIVFAALFGYTIQIYADFSGGIDIARGVARTMGIEMSHNFMRPYFADSLSEFWRRWHMSLSFWTRDYIFYPISLSKTFGKLGKDMRSRVGDRVGKLFPVLCAQMATFVVIGIWHGAEFKYVAYGLYNAFIIILGLLLEPQLKAAVEKLHINAESRMWKVFQMLRTLMIVTIGRMFPKAASFTVALSMYTSIFKGNGGVPFSEQILQLGLTGIDYCILLGACAVWFVISFYQEKGIKIRDALAEMNIVLRWVILILGVTAVLVAGIYGPGYDAAAFIYRGF